MAPVPEGGFRWEVAFSLLGGDLDVAKAIVALLEDRISSFLYSEAQLEIAATDGLETFTTVFRRDARVVVVLSRKNWGQTKWTRIEPTAITNRGFDEGWDFLILIPLDGAASVPDWLPGTQIWADYERLGPSGAAAIIERKLTERSAAVRPETAAELARRLQRAAGEEESRRAFLGSVEGVASSDRAFVEVVDTFKELGPAAGCSVGPIESTSIILTKDHLSMSVSWTRTFGNTLDRSRLLAQVMDGRLSHHIDSSFRAKSSLHHRVYHFDRRDEVVGWRAEETRRFFRSAELAEHLLKALINAVHDQPVDL